jgi:hypothetical protein
VARPSGRWSTGPQDPTEEGARRRLGAGRARSTLPQVRYASLIQLVSLGTRTRKGRTAARQTPRRDLGCLARHPPGHERAGHYIADEPWSAKPAITKTMDTSLTVTNSTEEEPAVDCSPSTNTLAAHRARIPALPEDLLPTKSWTLQRLQGPRVDAHCRCLMRRKCPDAGLGAQ